MSNHTPGPWIAVEGDMLEGEVVITTELRRREDIVSICDMDTDYEGEIGIEQEANARLIVAAPELLEALQELLAAELAFYPSESAGREAQDAWADRRATARNNASFVIAKATGR